MIRPHERRAITGCRRAERGNLPTGGTDKGQTESKSAPDGRRDMTQPNPQQTNNGQQGTTGGQPQQLPAQLPAAPQQVGQPAPGTPVDQQGQPIQGGLLQPGQPGQQSVNPWSGLLDVAPQQGQLGQQGQPGQYIYGQQGQVGQPPAQGLDANAIADLIARQVQSTVDRQINALRNPQYQQAHGQQPQGQPQQQPQQYPPPAPVPTGPSDGDLREARMAAREYTAGQITFGSVDEQAVAADLAAAMIPGMLARGFTPDQAGRDVAGQVAQRITTLRRTYEEQMIRSLRSRGALREDGAQPAGFVPASVGIPVGGQPVSQTDATRVRAKAGQMSAWAAEENTQRGWETTPAAK